MIPGKRVVFGFAIAMALVAAIGLGGVVKVLSMPVAEREQRMISTQLTLAYQKYRFDHKDWPVDASDAAEGFRTENVTLLDRILKAEKEWGMKTRLINPDSDNPNLEIVFEKPAHFERLHALYKNKPRGAGSARASY